MVAKYDANLSHTTECVAFAGRVRARLVAAFGWPDDADDRHGLCEWGRVEPIAEEGESYTEDTRSFVVTRKAHVRGELSLRVRAASGTVSAPLKIQFTVYKTQDGEDIGATFHTGTGLHLRRSATDEQLSEQVLAGLEPALAKHLATCFA